MSKKPKPRRKAPKPLGITFVNALKFAEGVDRLVNIPRTKQEKVIIALLHALEETTLALTTIQKNTNRVATLCNVRILK